jgi:hypothetical protein
VAELEQFALDSLISLAGILPGHALNQHNNSVINARTTNAVRVGLLPGHQAMMPAQDRVRRDQSMHPQHFRQSSD